MNMIRRLAALATATGWQRHRISRRQWLRLLGLGAGAWVGYETVRVLLGDNLHVVVPGRVYRSAQLSPRRLEQVIAAYGIRTVVNLRGCWPEMEWYQGDAAATCRAGICLEDLTFSAKRYPHPGELRRLVEVLERAEPPLLIHCARGADRTGLASVLAVLLLTDADLATARRQLGPRYGHFAVGRTAVLDEFFDWYAAWLHAQGRDHHPELLRQWVCDHYCPGPFRAELRLLAAVPVRLPAHRGQVLAVRACNRSIAPWRFTPGGSGGIHLRYAVFPEGCGEAVYRDHAGRLARVVPPGASITLQLGLPPLPPGRYVLYADLTDMQVIDLHDSDFAQYGSEPLLVAVLVG